MTKTIAVLMMSLAACGAGSQELSTSPPAPSATPQTIARLAVHRAQALHWLHDYAVAGRYPTDDAGLPVSEFQDERGVRCPMAELIHRSGHDDLVAMVVHADNELRLASVHAGPLHDWMLDSGLTGDEIAMVQGALTPAEEEQMLQFARNDAMRVASARGQVRGRLATAEVALHDATPHSLADAAQKLAAAAAAGKLFSRR